MHGTPINRHATRQATGVHYARTGIFSDLWTLNIILSPFTFILGSFIFFSLDMNFFLLTTTTELQEGDLVFFNTNGKGVSHVGIYLGNNKFIHASVSRGVMVNGLFEPYYLKRYIGGGRIEDKQLLSKSN